MRTIDTAPVSEAWIADRLRKHDAHPLGLARDEDFRISLAGVQEKTALLFHEGAWHLPRGATPTTHILKLPIGPAPSGIDLGDSVENEWLCLRIAAAFGLPVARAEMRSFEDVRVLVVERFDRRRSRDGTWLVRLPQEDVCQSLGLPPSKEYESDGGPGIASILDLLLQSVDPAQDRRTFFRALVVYWLLAAIDGHAKNFSSFLLAGGRCRMTPLYDVLSAHPIVSRRQLARQDLKLAMAVQGNRTRSRNRSSTACSPPARACESRAGPRGPAERRAAARPTPTTAGRVPRRLALAACPRAVVGRRWDRAPRRTRA